MIRTYKDIIDSAIELVYRTGIANKILQYMDKIRNVTDEGQARRWVMELLQNCSDTAYDGKNVDVRITLDSDKLVFAHNGRPFRVKDILSIINQVSSKNPDENTVGRFGTGFMSTFRLSEEVTIKSVLRDVGIDENGEEMTLPYRTFEVTLDRHGHSKEDVDISIKKSMAQLNDIDKNELGTEFDPSALNTSFIYKLDNDDSRKCAETGVNDLKNTIRFILLFAPAIGNVEIVNNISGEDVVFRRGENKKATDDLGCLEISEKNSDGERMHRLIYMSDGELAITAACDENKRFLPMDKLLPRVFTIFPLVGAENFPFPVVINSLSFRPNEPRNGITLVDNAQSVDAEVNKALMKRAVTMYGKMLESAAVNGFSDLENIVDIPPQYEDKEMSSSWVRQYIYEDLYKCIYRCSMINTNGGIKSLESNGVCIVDGVDEREKNAIKVLLGKLNDIYFPAGEEKWNDALRNYPVSDSMIINAEKLYLNTSSMLKKHFSGNKDELVQWCSDLCDLSAHNEELRKMIVSSQAYVFPSQDDQELSAFALKRYSEIYSDPDIPEILKDTSNVLDDVILQYDHSVLRIRSSLLNGNFRVSDEIMPRRTVRSL